MKLKEFLLLTVAFVLVAEATGSMHDDSSEESSEEEISSELNDDESLDDCQNRCVQQEIRNNNAYTQRLETACREGCEAQQDLLSLMKMEFPKTDEKLLVGNAVDKCWDSCLTKDLARGQFCMTGCSAMKLIQDSQKKTDGKDKEDKEEIKKEENKNNIRTLNDNYIYDDADIESEDSKEGFVIDNTLPENSLLDEEDVDVKEEASKVLDDEDVNSKEETSEVPKVHFYWIKTPSRSMDEYWSNILNYLFSDFDATDYHSSEKFYPRGQGNDNEELRWPATDYRQEAMTSDAVDIPSWYGQVSSSFDALKDSVANAVDSPGFQENLFYVLFGMTGLLIIFYAFNIVCQQQKQPDDHFYLPPGEALPVKLPTYDECIKADMDLCNLEQEYKINLNLPAAEGEKKITDGENEEKKNIDI